MSFLVSSELNNKMSAVIKQARSKYKISLLIEFFVFISVFALLSIGNYQISLSFLFGALSVFIPYCFFVFLMFFIKQGCINNLKMFYYGEFVKFILTIVFVVLVFKIFAINFIAFFVGYFFSLLLNNLLPFMVNKYLKI